MLQAARPADAQAMRGLPESEQHAIVHQIVRREMGVMAASALVVAVLGTARRGVAVTPCCTRDPDVQFRTK